MKRWVLQESKW